MSLGIGAHSLTASFGGTAAFVGSTSAAVAETVNPAATTVTLTSSVNPAVIGQAVTFTATVAVVAPGAGTPTGTVTFMDGGVFLGTVAVGADGTATFTTSFAAESDHAITATYNGDQNFAGNSQTISRAGDRGPVGGEDDDDTPDFDRHAVFGQPVTLTATVTSPVGVPTGTVTFKDGNTVLGIAAA